MVSAAETRRGHCRSGLDGERARLCEPPGIFEIFFSNATRSLDSARYASIRFKGAGNMQVRTTEPISISDV